LRDDVKLTVGARVECNDYTGNEFLPNVRLAWKTAPDHLPWGAATRAVRAPFRLDRDAFVPGAPPFLLAVGPDFRSEIADVYELGYRSHPMDGLSYSVTVFYAEYDRLRTQEIAPSRMYLIFGNGMEGTLDRAGDVGHVSAKPELALERRSQPEVPAYTAVDARVAWKPLRELELSITGQNLFGHGHAEFSDPLTRSVIRPNVFFKVLARF
jgi:iron complex outermembrane receptor protein